MLEPYRLVGDPHALAQHGLFVAEGRLVVERLLAERRFRVHSVLVTPAAARALAGALARRPEVPVHVCAPAALREIVGFDFHRGCVALAHRPDAASGAVDLASATRLLAIESVRDPDNVGGLFRTALAFGVDALVLDAATADPLYRKAVRTSMAATLRLPFRRAAEWLPALASLRAGGVRIIALTPHPDAVPLASVATRQGERFAIAVGSEGDGLRQETLASADLLVRIPVDPRADSLNVVSAAAIALYRLTSPITAAGS